jgi:hypothetical protein
MKKPLYPVSDHAVIRWLERVRGMDIESVRREIGHKAAVALDHPGAEAVLVDGVKLQLREGVVTTVVDAPKAWKSNRRYRAEVRGEE